MSAPLLGDLVPFSRDKLRFLDAQAAGAPRPVWLRIPGRVLLLTEAEDVEHVLVANQRAYVKTPRLIGPHGRQMFGRGMLTSSGAEHLEKRRALAPFFQRRAVVRFADVLVATAEEVAARWQPGAVVDIGAEMEALTRTALLRTLFGAGADEVARLAPDLAVRQRYVDLHFRSVLPLRDHAPVGLARSYRQATRRIDSTLREAIAARRAGARDDGLVAEILSRTDGVAVDDGVLRDELLVFTITGYETLGMALAWTWHFLARDPAVDARVADELAAVVGTARPAAEHLPRLGYLEAVLSEALRLRPPTWIFVRVAVDDDELPGGASVPAGTTVFLCPWVTHRDPRYFPDPERFDPSRFAGAGAAARPDLAYFPFGAGLRLCIGKPFALMQALLVLATLARQVRLVATSEAPVEIDAGILLAPKEPLLLRVEDRPRRP